ncbi:phosphogluconate dehydrogenase (NAD(+)-dependent, decarboxylating) [uncultured Georgenia sp.]|uniref:phosphogluconate dehydrogenase (NAD(+)-dependent, decarboxylating) n=1 Tax=uncultured Georgenia sp. TaxID=378209 RepID=UPI00262928BF|nr:decarboxylating 6-phosphogluconate dehydrogenase [uncultured Georgenia sp.]HLV03794.1 decarboxylating 6-phosphogluconate dehydrogenase [Actinomycetaceae bacterium]
MHIGMVGLGRMGGNMRARIEAAGHTVTGYDTDPAISDVPTLADLAAAMTAGQRVVWIMVPAGPPTVSVLAELRQVLSAGDLVVEGGNSYYRDDQDNAAVLAERGIGYVDAGISGGVWGREYGYGTMVGGSPEDVARLMPIFDALRPEGPREEGFVHVGPVGAGHFAKMVHNGIEYGLMQAYAEGYEIMASRGDLVPDVTAVVRAWQRGTVVRSWLLELLVDALEQDPGLASIDDYTADSGEGRWTLEEAIDNSVPAPTIAAALFARFSSRQEQSPAMKAVASLREQFGGHAVRRADER